MCECLRVVFVCVSMFVREFVYASACDCLSVCDEHMYVCVCVCMCVFAYVCAYVSDYKPCVSVIVHACVRACVCVS